MASISFQDFSCFYKTKKGYVTALSHLDFDIEAGVLFVIVGESGSGKTTLLKSIAGLSEYVSGNLSIFGTPIDKLDIKHNNTAYIRQEPVLYSNMTIYENIAFSLRMMHTPQDEVDARVKEVASFLEIDWLLTRKPKQLSGGQQQRVAIAKAIIKHPEIILFDEPFSNMDPIGREKMCNLVKQIHAQYHSTIVFVTHNLNEAFSLADKVLVLEEGKIKSIGTPELFYTNIDSELLGRYTRP